MSTLHDLLEAAIKERLAVAQKAAFANLPPWRWGPISVRYDGLIDALNGIVLELTKRDIHRDSAAFIAANGPDRIIRDCTEDLRLLSQHEPDEADVLRGLDPECACGHGLNRECPQVLSIGRRYGIKTSILDLEGSQ
jgi:hypothetical protein